MEKLAEQENLPKRSLTPLPNYFKVILNIGFILCLIPFRLIEGPNRFLVSSNRIQKIACGVVHFIILFRSISVLRFLNFTEEMHSMSKTYQLSWTGLQHVRCVIDIVYCIGFVYTFWTRKSRICKMVSLVEKLDVVENRGKYSKMKIRLLAVSTCLLLATFVITDTRLHWSTALGDGNIEKYFSELYQEAQRLYLFRHQYTGTEEPLDGILWKILKLFFTGIHFVTALQHIFMAHVLELFLVLTVICLCHLMKDFLRFCKTSGNINEVLTQYEILKEIVKTVNGVIRILILCCVGVSLPFYTFWTAVVYFEDHVMIHFSIHFGTFFILLTVAAEFNAKAMIFYTWVSSLQKMEELSSNRLISLNMDMNSNQLAIRGRGFFTMTYRFFGTILGVLVTYTVVIIQFQVTRQGFGMQNSSVS